jgi:hypothetical protein
MKKDNLTEGTSDDLPSEYDFSSGVRGKYTDRVSDKYIPASAPKEGSVERLMSRLYRAETKTLKDKVAHTLNLFPDARDSDITLANHLIRTFYSDYVDSKDRIALEDFSLLPKVYDMQRIRAKIQNDLGLFLASEPIRLARKRIGEEFSQERSDPAPSAKPVSIYSDESGKTGDHLIVGSLWLYDAPSFNEAVSKLRSWRESRSTKAEFHFSKLTRPKLRNTLSFFEVGLKATPRFRLIALLASRKNSAFSDLEMLYRTYGELVIAGLSDEINSGRLSPPLNLKLYKDQESGSDELMLIELKRRLEGLLETALSGKRGLTGLTRFPPRRAISFRWLISSAAQSTVG